MVIANKSNSNPSEKTILPYMLFLYKSHLKERHVHTKQKYKIYSEAYDYKYNLTKELVRENLTEVRRERRRGIQVYELELMYDKLAAEKQKRLQTEKEEPKINK